MKVCNRPVAKLFGLLPFGLWILLQIASISKFMFCNSATGVASCHHDAGVDALKSCDPEKLKRTPSTAGFQIPRFSAPQRLGRSKLPPTPRLRRHPPQRTRRPDAARTNARRRPRFAACRAAAHAPWPPYSPHARCWLWPASKPDNIAASLATTSGRSSSGISRSNE